MTPLPLYISPARVAEILTSPTDHWTPRRARDWLRASKAAVKKGGRWYTTRDKLRAAFPEVYDELLEQAGAEASNDVE